MNKQDILELPRGGTIVPTSEGLIQFGAPPETIKDTMVMSCGVPQIYVMPKDFFHLEEGISVAEIEFPIYYNFFLNKKKTKIICLSHRIPDMKIAFREAVFGPANIDLTQDYSDNMKHLIPDLSKETAFFRGNLNLNDLVEFIPIKNQKVQINDVTILINENNNYFEVYDKDILLAQVNGHIEFSLQYDTGEAISGRYIPPRMGVTCLGPSHGFDPKQNTSGFIIWLNNRGIMIDPPAATTQWLHLSNVNPKYIDSIILTHCHSDHDAGTFQKILAEEKVSIYTTRTIMGSFLKKYSSLTQISEDKLLNMFKFIPITIHEPIRIHQGIFDFYYTLHSIPTIGFKVNFRDKTLIYSSDHLNEPNIIEDLYQKNIISEYRRNFLKNFPWECDIIYHEAGIPPLHTPIAYLNTLPKDIQKKMTIYHIAEKDFPKETDLTLAKFGIQHTNIIDIPEYPYDTATDILNILEKVEYFNGFNLTKINELVSILKLEKFNKGDIIIKEGTLGDKFYIITSGKVSISDHNSQVNTKQFGEYETFGEASLLLNEPRHATVKAETQVEAMTIDKESFLNLLRGTKLEKKLLHLASSRNTVTWNALIHSPLFKNTTSFQKTAFEIILNPFEIKINQILIEKGNPLNEMFLVTVENHIIEIDEMGHERDVPMGYLIGDIIKLQKQLPSNKTYKVINDGIIYKINRDDMLEYIETYPNIYMNLIYDI